MASKNSRSLAKNSDARVFIAPRGVGCGRTYEYHSCMKLTGISKTLGDSEPFYCPDPNRAGQFLEVAVIQGAESRGTATLTGPKPLGFRSTLEALSKRRGCEFDIQVHFGRCNDPSNFSQFEQSIVLEGVRISDYSTDDLVALNPGETAIINETISLSFRDFYDLFGLSIYEIATEFTSDGLILAIDYCKSCGDSSCGGCESCEEGCEDYYALLVPCVTNINGQNIYILHSHDGGVTWEQYTIPCAAVVESPLGSYSMICAGCNLLVSMNELGGPGHLWSIPVENVINNAFAGNSFLAIGYNIYDMWHYQGIAWLAMQDGRISAVDTSTLVEIQIEVGVNYTIDWYAVDGFDNDNLIFGGGGGQFAFRRNGSSLQNQVLVVSGVEVDKEITAVAMKTLTDWYVGTGDGYLYCTSNCGKNWSQASVLPGCIKKIEFASDNVGYILIGSPGLVYRTVDGGTRWSPVDDANAQIPVNAIMYDLTACQNDPNVFIAGGRIPISAPGSACDSTGGVPDCVPGSEESGVMVLGRI